jgi:glycosyltransferase involved in cell wall biosynthesis
VLVDGGSSDRTVEAACDLYSKTRVVRQSGRGKGAALEQGFAAVEGDIVVMLDADGSTDPAEIPHFVEPLLNGADYAKGSRFLDGGGSEDISRLRAAGNKGLTRLVNALFRTRYTDLCYGYNALWAEHTYVARNVPGFEIETAMNVRAAKLGLDVVEVPSVERRRLHGLSNLNTFRDGWRVLKTIFRERFSRKGVDADIAELLRLRARRSQESSEAAAERPSG